MGRTNISKFCENIFADDFADGEELLRPWKLVLLGAGLFCLLFGAFYYDISDWDVGISVMMAGLTYLTAPKVAEAFVRRDFRRWPHMLFWTWFSVDGCYFIYHSLMGNIMVRSANAGCSLPLYLFMGFVWLYRGSLRDLLGDIRRALRQRRSA